MCYVASLLLALKFVSNLDCQQLVLVLHLLATSRLVRTFYLSVQNTMSIYHKFCYCNAEMLFIN